MKSKKEIEEFYDNFVDYQKSMAVNERHLMLINKLIALGLNSKSNVFELGCGIGTITKLIADHVTEGKIMASDISPKAIEFAKKHVNKRNVKFCVDDITEFELQHLEFGFVTLFDVLEHVPMESHQKIFNRLSEQATENSLLVINIPHPAALEYDRIHNPERLQIIDQPLQADKLIKKAYNAGFVLDYFKSYSIWRVNDYQIMVFVKKCEHKNIPVEQKSPILQRLKSIIKKIK